MVVAQARLCGPAVRDRGDEERRGVGQAGFRVVLGSGSVAVIVHLDGLLYRVA